jgi:hypothetical protein
MADIKRYMPVAMFATLTSILIIETGLTLGWWIALQSPWPLRSLPYVFGAIPVSTIWIIKFSFRQFWRFIAIEVAFNLGFAYGFLGFLLTKWGIYAYGNFGPIHVFLMTMVHGILLYLYQLWQEGVLISLTDKK